MKSEALNMRVGMLGWKWSGGLFGDSILASKILQKHIWPKYKTVYGYFCYFRGCVVYDEIYFIKTQRNYFSLQQKQQKMQKKISSPISSSKSQQKINNNTTKKTYIN